jgi:N-terminal helicase PWI domain
MKLFDYQSFYITAKFFKNRNVIVWCTNLMSSDADERVNVEVAMGEKKLRWILRELAGDIQYRTRSASSLTARSNERRSNSCSHKQVTHAELVPIATPPK